MAKLLTATAVAGSLAMASFIWGSAQATPAPSAIHAPGNGVTLVGHHGGGGGGGGGGRVGGGGGGGGAVHSGGGGPRMGGGPRGGGSNLLSRSGGHNYGGHSSPRYANRDFKRSGPRGDMRRGNSQAFNRDRDRDHGDRNRRFAERHDNNHDHDRFNNRHRVFRNGVWVWVYGPAYYSYNDCWWLRQQAYATGNPYWWSRYNNCVGYY